MTDAFSWLELYQKADGAASAIYPLRLHRKRREAMPLDNARKFHSKFTVAVPSRWLGGSVVRWLGSCANPQPETHASRPENDGLVPKAPILKCRIILAGRANIMQIACAVAGSVPKFSCRASSPQV